MEQKEDDEQNIPLLPQLSECAVWIVVPLWEAADSKDKSLSQRERDRIWENTWEDDQVFIRFASGIAGEPGIYIKDGGVDVGNNGRDSVHKLKFGDHLNEQKLDKFHTTLILQEKDISKSWFELCETQKEKRDEYGDVIDTIPPFALTPKIKLIPEGGESIFWRYCQENYVVVRWGYVYFRGHLDRSTGKIMWEFIEWSFTEDEEQRLQCEPHLLEKYTEEDDVITKKETMLTKGSEITIADYSNYSMKEVVREVGLFVAKKLRKLCGNDDIHLVCGYWLRSDEKMRGHHENSTCGCYCGYAISTFKIEAKLDLSPMRLFVNLDTPQEWLEYNIPKENLEVFARALAEVRQQFVRSLPEKSEDLKTVFDRNFLQMSKKRRSIMYDDRRKELHFAAPVDPECHVTCKEPHHFDPLFYISPYPNSNDEELRMIVRQNWIRYQCLYGQDDEFNIFRSLCFAPPSSVVERYQIGLVALTLQILLSVGIALDTVQMWRDEYASFEDFVQEIKSFEYEFEETLIVIISIFTFAFILQRLRKTIESFKRFYRNMKEVCFIPTVIIALDFTSNIIVGIFMAIVTPFFLLQSDGIQTVVLNSFALTFFLELDDMANIYESDESYLLQEDRNGFDTLSWDSDWNMRQIKAIGSIRRSIQMSGAFLFSPLYEIYKIIVSLIVLCRSCCTGKKMKREDSALQSTLDAAMYRMQEEIKAKESRE